MSLTVHESWTVDNGRRVLELLLRRGPMTVYEIADAMWHGSAPAYGAGGILLRLEKRGLVRRGSDCRWSRVPS